MSPGAETESLSVLFADISDSTQLFATLGNDAGRGRLLECLDVMEREVERGGGKVINRIGDELMCTFPDAIAAANASSELHRAVEEANAGAAAALRIRIGFHHGPVVVEDDQLFGDTVHIAHRIASLAKAQQTLLSRECNVRIPPEA